GSTHSRGDYSPNGPTPPGPGFPPLPARPAHLPAVQPPRPEAPVPPHVRARPHPYPGRRGFLGVSSSFLDINARHRNLADGPRANLTGRPVSLVIRADNRAGTCLLKLVVLYTAAWRHLISRGDGGGRPSGVAACRYGGGRH